MHETHMIDDLTPVDADELDLVARLLAVVSPAEGGPHPGVQLSRSPSGSGRVWTITDGAMTVDVRSKASIRGLEEPVWMTARCVEFAVSNADSGGWCGIGIKDRRQRDGRRQADDRPQDDGTVTALINGQFTRARIDLPARPPVTVLRRPGPASVIATAVTDMAALLRAVTAASLTPVGVPVSGSPVGTIEFDHGKLIIVGTDRRGIDRAAEFRLDADVELNIRPALWVHIELGLAPFVAVGDHLPRGEVTVTLTSDGELWLVVGSCRVVFRGEVRRLEPDDLNCVVYVVGRVEGTGERVLSVHGGCPVDGVMVWLESRPEEYGHLERIEQLHSIVWHSEPEPYGFGTPDD